ncbi:MAG: MerR family transcriptional regulator [Anaerolineales bacterium]|nr:MerR family transcriptional regulator [Anaerolineales bacterium]
MGLTRKELAAMFGVSVSNIRSWEKRYKEHMTTPAQAPHDNSPKEYNDSDIAAFTIIARGREAGRSLDDIGESLAAELATFTDDMLPEPPEQPVTADNEAGGHLVPVAQFITLQRAYDHASGQLEAIESERVRLINDLAAERAARIAAERDASRLFGQLEEIKYRQPWYKRIFGRD